VVWVGNEIGGYGWLSTSPEWVGEIGAELQLRPGDGYIWNCFTVPQHRRKGIFRSLLIGIPRIAREEGLRRLWIGTVAIPAEKVVGPSGFTPVISWAGFAFAGATCGRRAPARAFLAAFGSIGAAIICLPLPERLGEPFSDLADFTSRSAWPV